MCMRSFNTGGSDARGMKHFAYNCVAILVEFMVRNDFEKVFFFQNAKLWQSEIFHQSLSEGDEGSLVGPRSI